MAADPLIRLRRFAQTPYTASLVAVLLCTGVLAGESIRLADFPPVAEEGRSEETTVDAQPPGGLPPAPSPVADLEQLLQSAVEVPALQQEVTTVSGQLSTVGRSPAAIFVITQEMIRRSGATCIPEALRMAPGIQVARVTSSQWSITARGFNNNIAGLVASNNKLLVLIDGRTVYAPFFNGTYWDVQDTFLPDIDRIEVIRGPGATIWGANAVNGVINVITKRAAATQGGLANAGGGSFEGGFGGARYGGQSGDSLHYRVYGKGFDRQASITPGAPATDDWRQARGGFRMDWTPDDADLVTFQGDMYQGEAGFFNLLQGRGNDAKLRGGNLLTRWTRTFSDDSDMSLQLYYDRADRGNDIGYEDQQFNTYDMDFRHHLAPRGGHNVIWGVGYRSVNDNITSVTAPPLAVVSFDPTRRTYDTFSTFAQDEISLTESCFLTLGAKVQHNDFTGWEIQPTIRMLYSPEPTWAAWAAVSRAVRTPSRIESDGTIAAGTIPIIAFSRNFDSEDLVAYEVGIRKQPEAWFSWDASLFFNEYQNLSSFRLTPPGTIPIFNTNGNHGQGYGAELSAQLDMTSSWRLTGSYSYLHLQIQPGPGTFDFLGSAGPSIERSSPHNQFYLMSSHELRTNLDLDLALRYVDTLPIQRVPSYLELNARLAWRPQANTELALVGQNLLDPQHPEFAYTPRYEIPRGVYGMITQQW